jgi:hypothetical protein
MALVKPIAETGLMLPWNWNNKYGIVQVQPRPRPGDQITCKPPDKRSFYNPNAKELLVHHVNCEPKAHGALGFGDETICAGEVWFEPLERIYFCRDSRQPGIAFNVTMYPHTNAIVDMDEELDQFQKQRSSYVSDSTDDEDVQTPGLQVREVQTPAKKSVTNKTPAKKKKKWVIKKKQPSPHVKIPPSPDS